jgi:hypothetical protein
MSRVTPEIRRSLENHVLEEIPAGDQMRVFRMSNGKDWCHLNEFIFTPRGHIVICGDTIISDDSHGIVSCVNYDLHWFAGQLSESYLCEKFFRRDEFGFDDCIEDLKDYLEHYEDGGETHARLKELIEELEDDVYEEQQNIHFVRDAVDRHRLGDALYENSMGFRYPRKSSAWLCGLQQRFSELYAAVPV